MLQAGGAAVSIAEARGDCEPSWWSNPHQHDETHLYFWAKGESAVSEQEAWDDAMRGIQKQLAEYIQTSVAPDGSSSAEISGRFDLREIEVRDAPACRSAMGRWSVYMLGRYKVSEYRKIREKIELAEQLRQDWAAAQSALNRGESTKAESLLKQIVAEYDQALSPGFALEDVKLKLAGLYLKKEPPSVLEARKWIQDVRKSTGEIGWRQQAEELERNLPPISLHDAFGDRKVGLFCCVRDAEPLRYSPEVAAETVSRMDRASVDTVLLRPKNFVMAANMFNAGSAASLLAEAKAAGTEVVFAVLLEIDPAKTGQMEEVYPEVKTEVLDAVVSYRIFRVSDGQSICEDQTKGWSRTGASKLLGPVFVGSNQLPKHAAAIAEMLADPSPAAY